MINFVDVSKHFGSKAILKHVTLQLPSPGMIALTGVSGAGKTTIGRMLLGLDTDYEGQIRGVPESRACVFQEERLLPQLTATQNVLFVNPKVHESQLRDAFDALGLAGERDTCVTKLSGGMRRRVSVLRALLSDAELIVMDEAMKGLDAAVARRTAQFIRQSVQGRTLIYITHSRDEIAWLGLNPIFCVEDGRLFQTENA